MRYRRIVVKVGSNVLASASGGIDLDVMHRLADQIITLRKQHVEVILVSSGAVASGRSMVQVSEKLDNVSLRQVWAAVGQVKLLHAYYEYFSKQQQVCAQVLVTKEDFRDRHHYANMYNCFQSLLGNGVIPIVNENDVVSVTELMFTDNDELAGLIATMMQADALFILTNVDGLFTGDPKLPESKLIAVVDEKSSEVRQYISQTKSEFGRGGMLTKSSIAKKVSKSGVAVHIANGKTHNILLQLLHDTKYVVGTTFVPVKKYTGLKKQIAFSETFTKGVLKINEGALQALLSSKATSLLPIGVTAISGDFQKGDLVKVVSETGQVIGIGKAQYGSKKAREVLGQRNQKPIIHYDYLYLNP